MILKYPGGQHYHSDLIVNLMRPHKIYYECCFGGGSVFFKKQKAVKNILTDIDPEVINFWKHIQLYYDILAKALRTVPYKQEAFEIWRDSARVVPSSPQEAMRFFILKRMSRGGLGKDFSDSLRTRRGMPEGESSWYKALDRFAEASQKLSNCYLEQANCFNVLPEALLRDDAQIYIDPPYEKVGEKLYKFGNFDHESMLRLITTLDVKAKVIISCYDSPLYRKYLGNTNWMVKVFDSKNRQGNGATVTPALWRNYL